MNHKICLVSLITLLCCGCQQTESIQFYVAADGNDQNPGTRSQPFATLERSRDAIRGLAQTHGDVQVLLRGGLYAIRKPFVLEPRDSAPSGHTITYQAYANEKPLISGGVAITGWHKGEKNLWTVQLDSVQSGRWWFRDLYRDGKRLPAGRFPNDTMLTIASASADAKQMTFQEPLPAFEVKDGEVVILQNWSISRSLLAAANQHGVSTQTPCGWVGHPWTTAEPGKRAFLEGALEFVDRPGEWCLQRRSGRLYYLAADNEDPNEHVFIAPLCDQLLLVQGRQSEPVRNIHFQGLTFSHANWLLPETGYAGIQACFYGPRYQEEPTYGLPLTIQLSYAENCRFSLCRLLHTGASGLGLAAGCRNTLIQGCEFFDIGGNGVMISWRAKDDQPPRRWFENDWTDVRDIPENNQISNCYVHECGAKLFGAVGIFAAFCQNTVISHNEVCDLPYTGISIGFRWDTTATSQARCRVEYNHIHHVMRLLADGGGIYTLGLQPGTELIGNLIHDVSRSSFTHGGAPNNGIFFDQGSKGYLIEKNIIYATSGEAVRFNENQKEWHQWRDNSFGPSPHDPGFPSANAQMAGLEFEYKNLLQ